MENAELNKWIHENIMGFDKCICPILCDCQDYQNGLVSDSCPEHNEFPDFDEGCPYHSASGWDYVPQYCSSLDLIHAVEMKVIETVGRDKYGEILGDIVEADWDRQTSDIKTKIFYEVAEIATATALQRARACEKAHKLAMEGKDEAKQLG